MIQDRTLVRVGYDTGSYTGQGGVCLRKVTTRHILDNHEFFFSSTKMAENDINQSINYNSKILLIIWC
jgi:hypothetical protein